MRPGAFVLLRDGNPVVYVERGGKGIVRLVELEGEELIEAVAELAAAVEKGRMPKLGIERVDGDPVIGSEHEASIVAAGFSRQPRKLSSPPRGREEPAFMPEGDTIHRAAAKVNAALGGRALELADAPNPRSPIHTKAEQLRGATLELAEAFGKHLVVRFSGDVVLHSHLGMNGRIFVAADGRLPYGKPWLRLASGRAIASQSGGKILRLIGASRLANDPSLRRLGPDPLRPGFDPAKAATRLRRFGAGREVGEAVLDQEIIAGIGNVIRVEALFRAAVDPWRKVEDLTDEEVERVVRANQDVMRISIAKGRRPHAIYKADRKGCPSCRGPVSARGQGDDNRITYWCPNCQR